mgnify:CR=1 FL=1
MNRNQVLPQVQLSPEPSALKKVDFCAPQTYRGAGFLAITDMPRLAKEVASINPGDGFAWATKLGHTVVVPSVALVPVALKDQWIKKLSGLTLRDIKLKSSWTNETGIGCEFFHFIIYMT